MMANTLVPYVQAWVFPPAFAVLPGVMDSPEARALLIAIGLQESGFIHRRQVGGPARGFWQFEAGGGVTGALTHATTRLPVAHVCAEYGYPATVAACYPALEHHDPLACALARLLLWTLPARLADRWMPDRGWEQYLAAWRPGKPRRAAWDAHFADAWSLVVAA